MYKTVRPGQKLVVPDPKSGQKLVLDQKSRSNSFVHIQTLDFSVRGNSFPDVADVHICTISLKEVLCLLTWEILQLEYFLFGRYCLKCDYVIMFIQ